MNPTKKTEQENGAPQAQGSGAPQAKGSTTDPVAAIKPELDSIEKMMFRVALLVIQDNMKLDDAIEKVATEDRWREVFGVNRQNEAAIQRMRVFSGKMATNITAAMTRLEQLYRK